MTSQEDLVDQVEQLLDCSNVQFANGRVAYARKIAMNAYHLANELTVKNAMKVVKSKQDMKVLNDCKLMGNSTVIRVFHAVKSFMKGEVEPDVIVKLCATVGDGYVERLPKETDFSIPLPSQVLEACCNLHDDYRDKDGKLIKGNRPSSRFFKDENGAFGACDKCAIRLAKKKQEITKEEALEICLIADVMDI